jgi:hypothetical protein
MFTAGASKEHKKGMNANGNPSWLKQSAISDMVTVMSLVQALNLNALRLEPNSTQRMFFGHNWDKGVHLYSSDS